MGALQLCSFIVVLVNLSFLISMVVWIVQSLSLQNQQPDSIAPIEDSENENHQDDEQETVSTDNVNVAMDTEKDHFRPKFHVVNEDSEVFEKDSLSGLESFEEGL